MKFSTLKNKAVINVVTGEVLGYIQDLEIDVIRFEIKDMKIGNKSSIYSYFLPFLKKEKGKLIKMDKIKSIGSDVILVHLEK